jgi:23S rRNA (uracil1939-C5)-methyltransferase
VNVSLIKTIIKVEKKQLEFKHRVVTDNLERIGGFRGINVEPVIGMEEPMHYRNKAQYPVQQNGSRIISGFYARRSHQIIETTSCGIQDRASELVRNSVIKLIKHYGISVYNENTGEGILKHIITRVAWSTGDIMVVLVVTTVRIKQIKKLAEHLAKEIPAVKSVILNINTRRDNVILGEKVITVYGKDTLIDTLGPFKFHISPLSFYQVNPIQTVVLYQKAVEFAGLTGNETVFDLYCGIGTISLFLAQKAKKVIGVEVVEEAVKAANKNAKLNGIKNTEFYAGTAEEIVPQLYRQGNKADIVVVDPPRKGCDKALLETIIQMRPARIVYVSCNPSTLARDLKFLSERGYIINQVQPVDLFPWTYHVESCVLITRDEKWCR